MVRRNKVCFQMPANVVRPVGFPEFLGDFDPGRLGSASEDCAFELEIALEKRFAKPKGQWAAWKDFAGGVARRGSVGLGKVQFGFVERTVLVPEPGGGAFSDQLQPVEPRAFAGGAEVFERLLVEIHKRGWIMWQSRQVHKD